MGLASALHDQRQRRMSQAGYKQFCPLAMAAELLCTRWTMVLLRELVAGTTRFNDLRRGVPKMSPTLLAQRLRELEAAGIVERRPLRSEKGVFEYHLTESGRDLRQDGREHGRRGNRQIHLHRRPRNCRHDAGLAGPQPLCRGAQAHRCLIAERVEISRRAHRLVAPIGEGSGRGYPVGEYYPKRPRSSPQDRPIPAIVPPQRRTLTAEKGGCDASSSLAAR